MSDWIAVVDDDVLSLSNARKLLGEENLRVSCLRSGKDLLKFMENNNPDLVLLDVMMPEMDGFETLAALRSFEENNGRVHIPVIFLTGENDIQTENRGLKAGASDFIKKPFDKNILSSRIHNIISNSKKIEILTEEASMDKLTGFLNKVSGTAKIIRHCEKATGALLVMDLDNFKLVNDFYGHDMGDRALIALSDIIRNNTKENDIVSRIGGDEFMIFADGIVNEKDIADLSERINKDFSDKAAELLGNDHGIPLGISAGVVMVPEYGRDFESLFSMADSTLFNVKNNGKHGYSLYNRGEETEEYTDDNLESEIIRITRIVEERNYGKGALLLGKEAFATAYRFVVRFNKMYGGSAVKLLFSLSVEDENRSALELTEIYAQFGMILQKMLRKSDIIMQNRPNQFFAYLPELSKDDMPAIMDRIMKEWKDTSYSTGVTVESAMQFVLSE